MEIYMKNNHRKSFVGVAYRDKIAMPFRCHFKNHGGLCAKLAKVLQESFGAPTWRQTVKLLVSKPESLELEIVVARDARNPSWENCLADAFEASGKQEIERALRRYYSFHGRRDADIVVTDAILMAEEALWMLTGSYHEIEEIMHDVYQGRAAYCESEVSSRNGT